MELAELRSTSFRLPDVYFGSVFVYKPGERFKAAYRRLSDAKGPSDREPRRLPDASLRTALTIISGDFVTLEAWRWAREDWAIVSRTRIAPADLRRALAAWEYVVWPDGATGELSAAAEDLVVENVSVTEFIGRRPRRCPSPEAKWIWKAATWEVAHRLASRSLLLDNATMASLRLDSEGNLLTWDNPQRGGRNGSCAAMHVIAPRLITIPGLEEPVVHFQSSFVRLATAWNWVRNAWISHNTILPLLYCHLRRQQNAAGEWISLWDDLTPEVLRKCNLDIPSSPADADLSSFGAVRARQRAQRYPIGTGTGQMFHDAVALHARRCLPDSSPLEMIKARRSLARPTESLPSNIDLALKANCLERLHITCLYGEDKTRRRVTTALRELLGLSTEKEWFAANDVEASIGAVTVKFISPPGAAARLSGDADRADLESWIGQAFHLESSTANERRVSGAIVETGDPDELRGSERDPKHVIRRTLAAKGIVTQFLSSHEDENSLAEGDPTSDHPAESAVWDLLRSAGIFPRPFPSAEGFPENTWLVGVYVVQRHNDKRSGYRRKYGEGFVVSIVGIQAGGHTALGFDPIRGWRPLHEFTAQFLACPQDHAEAKAKSLIEGAVGQLLVRAPNSKLVVFLGAQGCRRFWKGLQDTGGDELPLFANADRVGIIRVRTEPGEVPRVAGLGDWPTDTLAGPQRPRTTNALYRIKDEQWPGAMYYVSTSSTMDRQGPHRDCTRFSCPPTALRKNWHAHTMTEFWSPFPGPFREDSLYELASLLCRQAPTWSGTLDRPSPIHLAEAVVLDHPDKYEVRDEDGATLE